MDQCAVQTQSNHELFGKRNASGSYTFLFSNKDALELSEIYDYFSKFEHFINVQGTAGDEKGLRFVRFKSFEAAKKAMDKTIKHPRLNLIPNGLFKYDETEKENVDCASKNEHKTKKSEYNESVENHKDASMKKKSDIILALIKKLSCDNRIKAVESPEVKHQQKHKEIIISNKKNAVPRGASADKEVIPLLATNASEVIVANLNHSVNAAYILHLVEKYEPLAVSYVQTVPYKNMRYCHVYFKTAFHAMKAERKLDRFDLNGNRLIALYTSDRRFEVY